MGSKDLVGFHASYLVKNGAAVESGSGNAAFASNKAFTKNALAASINVTEFYSSITTASSPINDATSSSRASSR